MWEQQHSWPCSHTARLLPRKTAASSEVTAELCQGEIHQKEKLSYQITSPRLFCERQKAASLKYLLTFPLRSMCCPAAGDGERLRASHLPTCSLLWVTWQTFPTSSYNSHKKLKAHGSSWMFFVLLYSTTRGWTVHLPCQSSKRHPAPEQGPSLVRVTFGVKWFFLVSCWATDLPWFRMLSA